MSRTLPDPEKHEKHPLFDAFLEGSFPTPFPSRRFSSKPVKRWLRKGSNYIDFFDSIWEPPKVIRGSNLAMKNGLFCGTFRVSQLEKFLRFGLKSNKETPKEITKDPLTSLRPSP